MSEQIEIAVKDTKTVATSSSTKKPGSGAKARAFQKFRQRKNAKQEAEELVEHDRFMSVGRYFDVAVDVGSAHFDVSFNLETSRLRKFTAFYDERVRTVCRSLSGWINSGRLRIALNNAISDALMVRIVHLDPRLCSLQAEQMKYLAQIATFGIQLPKEIAQLIDFYGRFHRGENRHWVTPRFIGVDVPYDRYQIAKHQSFCPYEYGVEYEVPIVDGNSQEIEDLLSNWGYITHGGAAQPVPQKRDASVVVTEERSGVMRFSRMPAKEVLDILAQFYSLGIPKLHTSTTVITANPGHEGNPGQLCFLGEVSDNPDRFKGFACCPSPNLPLPDMIMGAWLCSPSTPQSHCVESVVQRAVQMPYDIVIHNKIVERRPVG